LSVTQLRAAQVGVAPAQARQISKHSLEGRAEIDQIIAPALAGGRERGDGLA
jgi:hypothetical protein